MKTLYLIDISSFIFRAYYAIRPLSAHDGTPVNAVYGVISMMNNLIKNKKPDHLIVCNDRPDKGFRNEIFPEYKANRSAPPEDLVPQFDLIKEFVQTYPIHAIDKKGFEADDIIATLVEKYRKEQDMQIYIVSSDKDLMQLVGGNVFLYDTMKEKISSTPEVIEKFGVPPDKVVDVQSLSGDAVDNIPGIPGVGPKTASKLVNEFGSLENVLNNADKIKGKVGEKLKSEREKALISKQLVELRRDVDIDLTWEDMTLDQPDIPSLNAFYKRLNFNKFVLSEQMDLDDGFTGEVPAPEPIKPVSSCQYVLIDSVERLKGVASNIKLTKPDYLAFDTETDNIDALQSNLVGFSFCYTNETSYYVPLGHKTGKNISLQDFKEYFGPILSDPNLPKVAQNGKFDINVLSLQDITIHPLAGDTMIASYLIDANRRHNLDVLAETYLNHQTIKFESVVTKGMTFADADIQVAKDYAAEDAWVAFELNQRLLPELKKNHVESVYNDIEMPLVPVLARMEQNGILVDQNYLDELETEFEQRLKKLETKIHALAGREFNINSPKQLGVILFEELKLPTVKKTKTGYSTDVDVLTELASQHELPAKLLEYRTLTKLLSTYVVQLKNIINPRTKRVHTSFNQTIAATGRLSSTEPNLQNIPIKTEEGKRIRNVFIAKPGCVLFSADYSQIELRLLAALCQDPKLMEAYQKEIDIHAQTASHVLGVKLADVDSQMRGIGKTINFGVVYGQSPFGLAKQLDVPQSEAKRFIDGFYREFSRVAAYREEILEEARKNGYVTTYLGRRRLIPEINSGNKFEKQNGERVAFNTVFQGSAADLIKKAMIEIDAWLIAQKLQTKMLLQVHDELVFEVPKDELEVIQKNIPQMMENAFKLDVPLKVSSNFGKNWAEAH